MRSACLTTWAAFVFMSCVPAIVSAQVLTPLYGFTGGADGARPYSRLYLSRGILYGTTYEGGSSGLGTIFAFNLSTSAESVLHSFAGGIDGSAPLAGVIRSGSTLYGTTDGGGTAGDGTVFDYDLTTGSEETLYSFLGTPGGEGPWASVIKVGGALYGTTAEGGRSGDGMVFKLITKQEHESVVWNFSNGGQPNSELISVSGELYGTTYLGGTYNLGTVFKVDPLTKKESILHNFSGAEGSNLVGGLVFENGKLYGTASTGGSGGKGTLFEVNPVDGSTKVLHSFLGGSDGSTPVTTLAHNNGLLYGTTNTGGYGGFGTIFEYNLAAQAEVILYGFVGNNDGAYPNAVVYDGGVLYGTASGKGASGFYGTIFRLTP